MKVAVHGEIVSDACKSHVPCVKNVVFKGLTVITG